MRYELQIANEGDKPWLDDLRRVVYKDLMIATFGTFDEERHQRHCKECWEQRNINIVKIGAASAGMIQLAENVDSIELCEIQLHPNYQGKHLGQTLLQEVIARSIASGKKLVLSAGLKNVRAKAFYERLGFRVTGQNDTHYHMRFVGEET